MKYRALLCMAVLIALGALGLATEPGAQIIVPPAGPGATFWVYVADQNQTAKFIRRWRVEISQRGWRGVITSDNPQTQAHAPRLSDEFEVKVFASGPNSQHQELPPQAGTHPKLGCNANCDCMVGIIANHDGVGGYYWTVSDAVCRQ